MKRNKSEEKEKALVKKAPTSAEMHPLFPLNQMNCPRCHEPFKGYEEVRVPAVSSAKPGEDEKLVKIEELEDWAQLAFQGYKSVS